MKRLLLILFCLLSACAPSGQQAAKQTLDSPQTTPDQQLADFLGTAHTGTSAAFSGSSLGQTVTVTTQSVYISALGELCREGLAATPRGTTRIAVCRENETAPWRLAPAIFGQEAL